MTESREKSAEREPIRIVDRRNFTPEGVPRTPDAVSEEPSPPHTADRSAPFAGEPPRPARSGAGGVAADQGNPGEGDDRVVSAQFKNLILGLGNQAAAVLREVGSSSGQETAIGLDGARQMIDILEALRCKTRGNLTPDESTLLENLIYDLQMEFVSLQGRLPNEP